VIIGTTVTYLIAVQGLSLREEVAFNDYSVIFNDVLNDWGYDKL
jgi:hypothetical protein